MVRAELEHKRSTAFSTHDDQQRAEVEANRARENADNWRAQYERDQEELERLAAQLKEMHSRSAEAQKTASGIEQSSTGVRGAKKKRNEAEAKLHTKKRRAEKKLTTVFVVYASAYYRFIIARAPADGYTCFRVGVSRDVVALPVSRTEASAPHYRWSLHSAMASLRSSRARGPMARKRVWSCPMRWTWAMGIRHAPSRAPRHVCMPRVVRNKSTTRCLATHL